MILMRPLAILEFQHQPISHALWDKWKISIIYRNCTFSLHPSMGKFPSKLPPCIFINQQSKPTFEKCIWFNKQQSSFIERALFDISIFQIDCDNMIIMAPGFQSVLNWLEDIFDISQADIFEYFSTWIKRMFPIFRRCQASQVYK